MKMKSLKEKLAAEGCEVSERMIKYYIEIGILPPPDYKSINQAEYFGIHYVRLLKIAALKESGTPFSEIKRSFVSDNEYIDKYALENKMDFTQASRCDDVFAHEYIGYCFEYANPSRTYTQQELIEDIGCERLVFDIASDTGLIEKKQRYTHNDMLILVCVSNIFSAMDGGFGHDTIEKISEISRVNNIASQLANLYSKGDKAMWLYKNLTESIIRSKLEKNGR